MSHDELLAEIELRQGMELGLHAFKAWVALRAVVKLAGKLQDQNPFHEDAGWNAGYNHAMYEVIQAIEKELN